jgi:serine/threonine-protein kinase
LIGRTILQYEIVEKLGEGGMGTVYKARDTRLGRFVALKVLTTGQTADPALKKRFVREARSASALGHPGIVTIHDILDEDGFDVIVMELIDGKPLRELIPADGLPWPQAVSWAAAVADAMAAAHAAGIVHRDLNPRNVMITTDGRVKVLDFGVAKLVSEPREPDEVPGASAVGLTEHGTVVGTLYFMSPEQARGEIVDHRSDVFAFGSMLYLMLTGKLPFTGGHAAAILYDVNYGVPTAVRQLRDDVPRPLERLVRKAHEKRRQDRYQSMGEMVRELRALLMPAGEPSPRIDSASGPGSWTAPSTGGFSQLRPRPDTGVFLKTLVSTELVAGKPAAGLGERHRRLVRDLVEEHEGWELDESDGFLLLFERPVLAVRFALAYHRGVARLAAEIPADVAARAGIHVGEVVLRSQTPEEIAGGARPFSAEGPAKTLAERLRALAYGHQTLLSRGVFEVARRGSVAADEADRALTAVGGDGRPLLHWLAHGSYLLDGIEDAVEVFEVGEEGEAPLIPPEGSGDAVRIVDDEAILGWRPAPRLEVPQRPNWVLERKLGEGGFGEVWLGSHRKTRERRVYKFCYEVSSLRALKREITLFRLLKETLGERRDINRILDWNFDEAPYFIESAYTEGGSLAEWARQQGGLAEVPLATRLELVAQAAEALAAAHSVGVLHKDIKPANLLVQVDDDGTPHIQLTDFGIGMATDRERLAAAGITVQGGMTEDVSTSSGAGTRLYMAPELMEGKAATMQADVYALGVTLYQAVVGDFGRALAPGWERGVDDELLREDVAAAVDGSPARRLGDAARLADNLRRLEDRRRRRDEERAAREEAERTRAALQSARRRRRGMAAVLAALALFAGMTAFQNRRVEREAERARIVADFLVGLFEVADPAISRGDTITARELLDRGAARIDRELEEQPENRATLMHTMADVYRSLGLFAEGKPLAESALDIRRRLHGARHREVAESLDLLALLEMHLGDNAAAEVLARQGLDMRRQLFGGGEDEIAESMTTLAHVLRRQGKFEEAEALYREALEIRRRGSEPLAPEVAESIFNLAYCMQWKGDFAAAESYHRQALEMRRQLFGDEHPDVVLSLTFLGWSLEETGDLDAAEPLFRESLEIGRRLGGDRSLSVAISSWWLGSLLVEKGEPAAALPYAVQAEEIYTELLPPTHWALAGAAGLRGACLAGLGRFEEAEPLLLDSYVVLERELSKRSVFTLGILESLVELYDAWGRPAEAARYRAMLPRPAPADASDAASE